MDQERKLSLDELLLKDAIRRKWVPKDSTVEDLTLPVRKTIADNYFLITAIEKGYLPKDSTVEDLTHDIKEKMIDEKAFHLYRLGGSIEQNV